MADPDHENAFFFLVTFMYPSKSPKVQELINYPTRDGSFENGPDNMPSTDHALSAKHPASYNALYVKKILTRCKRI